VVGKRKEDVIAEHERAREEVQTTMRGAQYPKWKMVSAANDLIRAQRNHDAKMKAQIQSTADYSQKQRNHIINRAKIEHSHSEEDKALKAQIAKTAARHKAEIEDFDKASVKDMSEALTICNRASDELKEATNKVRAMQANQDRTLIEALSTSARDNMPFDKDEIEKCMKGLATMIQANENTEERKKACSTASASEVHTS